MDEDTIMYRIAKLETMVHLLMKMAIAFGFEMPPEDVIEDDIQARIERFNPKGE